MGQINIGVDNIARKVKSAYVGVDGVARKIKQVYVGDANGIARLVWSSSGNYLFCKYGSTDSYNNRDVFSVFDKSGTSTFTPVTIDKTYTNFKSNVKFARSDARTVVHYNNQTLDFYRRSGNSYSKSFSATMTVDNFKNYVPNSGDTAYIHSVSSLSFASDCFGLSSDGKYFYINVVGYLSPAGIKKYTSCILIFDISSNSLVFKQAIKVAEYSTLYGTLYTCSATASDDLSVFAVTYGEYDANGATNTYYYHNVLIGAIGESYTKGGLNGSVSSGDSYAIYSNRYENLRVSPDGNYVSFCLSVYNPEYYVYYNQKNGYAKIDKTNKTVSGLIALGAAYEDVYTAGVKDWNFVGNDYLYFLTTTSSYSDEGRLVLFVYKKNNNGDFQKTTKIELTIPISPSEYFYSHGDEGYYKTLNSVAFDFENKIAVFFEGRGRYDICELNGGNGAFTGYTKIGEGSFGSTLNVEGAYLG